MKKTNVSDGSDMPHGGKAQGAHAPAATTLPSGGLRSSSKVRRMVATVIGAFATLVVASGASALAENRTLDLYNAHTRERLTITFKKNGRYVPSALSELNHFLRDWRRNEQRTMDPRLFDTVWELYQKSGATQPIHVVCGYRALATNEMLRSRSSGVAKHSQHTQGKAMDMFIPGVSINRLREIGMKMQNGGVGWYPTSGSPFVHIDVGTVRAWPRMTRAQLVRLFPDGKTVHLPSDGKPLPGYQQALAELRRNGSVKSATAVASADDDTPRKGGGLIAMLFGGGEEDAQEEISAASDAPARKRGAEPAKPAAAAATAAVVRTKPAAPVEAVPGVGDRDEAPAVVPPVAPPPAPVVVAAVVPKPTPAPDRPEPPAPTSLAAATLPADAPPPPVVTAPVVVAAAEVDAPLPPSKPAELAEMQVALAMAPMPPRARSEILPAAVEAPLVTASLPDTRPALPPVQPAEPANAQLALAEVAHDSTPMSGSASALGYAAATATVPAPQRPALRVASLAPPPAATRGLMAGQSDPLAALPATSAAGEGTKADPLVAAAAAPAAADLPVYDARQSAYWGVFAQLVHPDQRRMSTLFSEPSTVIQSSFSTAPYGDLKTTRFTGTALPRLDVVRFTRSSDLAMR